MFGSMSVPELILLGLIVVGAIAAFSKRGTTVAAIAPSPSAVAEILPNGMKRCPLCAEEIQAAAIVCKHCGRDLHGGVATAQRVMVETKPSAGVAAVLSLVIPGAGQMYRGHVGRGLVWFVVVIVGYLMFIVPGMVLHLACIVLAAVD